MMVKQKKSDMEYILYTCICIIFRDLGPHGALKPLESSVPQASSVFLSLPCLSAILGKANLLEERSCQIVIKVVFINTLPIQFKLVVSITCLK